MKTKSVPVPENWQKLKYHLYSGFIPFGVGIDQDALLSSMLTLGYLPEEPIYLLNGQILGGRHRHSTAIKADVIPTFREFIGTDLEALQFVETELGRRQLSESQRAMFGAELFKMKREAIPKSVEENIPTQSETAEHVRVSEPTFANANKVLEKGTPSVQEAVKAGKLAVSDAAKIVEEAPKLQDRALKAVEQGKATTASQAVKRLTGGKKPVLCEQCKASGKPVPNCKNCRMAENADKKRKAEAKTEKNGEPTELKDEFGNIVPKRCRDAYADPWIQETIDFLSQMVSAFWAEKFADGMNKRKKRYPFIESTDFIDGCGIVGNTLDDLVKHLQEKKPAGVCPECEGKGCGCCIQSGLLPRAAYEKVAKKTAKAK